MDYTPILSCCRRLLSYGLLIGSLLSCKNESRTTDATSDHSANKTEVVPVASILPFTPIPLNTLDLFKAPKSNWKLVGDVYVDPKKTKSISGSPGTGVLLNQPTDEAKGNLITAFEHGDIELELEVMLPVGSNSGLYFQSRYEVQLLDSWGKADPTSGDMGGIYQRWDDNKPEGKKGYEGYPPAINAAKAPGLWQKLRVLFHAPRFDAKGTKIQNAAFKEVWLNGRLIHEDVSLSGPTLGGNGAGETPMAPLMIQGDHGPIAFKNIRYKLYGNNKTTLTGLGLIEYEGTEEEFPNLDTLQVVRKVETDSISARAKSPNRDRSILAYSGTLNVPKTGDYLFEFLVSGTGYMILEQDTLFKFDSEMYQGFAQTTLEQGPVPFRLVYNKNYPWVHGMGLFVEGPEDEKHPLHAPGSLVQLDPAIRQPLPIRVEQVPVIQRSFVNHHGGKRTHALSVGTPAGTHYTYDLASGTLLQAWDGAFLDASDMWLDRGIAQLGIPIGFTIQLNSDPDFALFEDPDSPWPTTTEDNAAYKTLGYEINEQGYPTFLQEVHGSTVRNTIVPTQGYRGLVRTISQNGTSSIWHKIAEGEQIKKLPDGSYLINDESYFIRFPEGKLNTAQIEKSGNGEALLMEIPANKQIYYTITW